MSRHTEEFLEPLVSVFVILPDPRGVGLGGQASPADDPQGGSRGRSVYLLQREWILDLGASRPTSTKLNIHLCDLFIPAGGKSQCLFGRKSCLVICSGSALQLGAAGASGSESEVLAGAGAGVSLGTWQMREWRRAVSWAVGEGAVRLSLGRLALLLTFLMPPRPASGGLPLPGRPRRELGWKRLGTPG